MARRFAVILFADVVDYSLMMGEDEEATIGLIRHLRDKTLEPVLASHGGEVLKRMGDGWIFAFPSVATAIAGARAVQEGLASDPVTRLRMGLHMGDIVEDDADIYGAGVNLAARLLTEAPPGGLMISDDVYHQLAVKEQKAFADAGTFNLKNISRPVQGFQWRVGDLAAQARREDVPVIAVEAFSAAPRDGDAAEAAADLRDQVIHALSRRTGIRVIDATGTGGSGATYALRGRLRQGGGRARASLSLVLAGTGASIWTERYEAGADDIFGFCDDVAVEANNDLRWIINSLDNMRIDDVPDANLSVSELRTRGAFLFYKLTIPATEQARSVLDRARRLNPEDGMSQAMWAHAVCELAGFRFQTPDPATLAAVTEAFDRAVELLPQSDFVFFARSHFRSIILRDAERAMADARRCQDLNPDYPLAHEVLGLAHLRAGDFAQAAAEFEAASTQQKDPLWPRRQFYRAVAQVCSGDHDAAIATLRDLIDLRPRVRGFRTLLALVLEAAGQGAEAQRQAERAAALPDGPSATLSAPPVPDDFDWLRAALTPGRSAET